jgi:hypothetical protein
MSTDGSKFVCSYQEHLSGLFVAQGLMTRASTVSACPDGGQRLAAWRSRGRYRSCKDENLGRDLIRSALRGSTRPEPVDR